MICTDSTSPTSFFKPCLTKPNHRRGVMGIWILSLPCYFVPVVIRFCDCAATCFVSGCGCRGSWERETCSCSSWGSCYGCGTCGTAIESVSEIGTCCEIGCGTWGIGNGDSWSDVESGNGIGNDSLICIKRRNENKMGYWLH